MPEHEIAARFVTALGAAADQIAADATSLLSINIEMLTAGESGEIATTLTRKTKTLVFQQATLTAPNGAPIATASSIHRLKR